MTTRIFDEERVRALMRQAFGAGALIVGATIQWNIAGQCDDPAAVSISGRLARNIREASGGDWKDIGGKHRMSPTSAERFHRSQIEVTPDTVTRWSELALLVRCRKCGPCRRYNRWLWQSRCSVEIAASFRTWFGTLTLRPTDQTLALLRAQQKAARSGVVWETLNDDERFQRQVNAISPEITKYLKRIRKNSGAKIRYCLVAEEHKSGLPHFHILVHETTDCPVRHELLKKEWLSGFSNFKLADKLAAIYLTKYLVKANRARIRASVGYGKTA